MLIEKNNAIGVDFEINKIQNKVYNYLTNVKGYTNYDSFPRVYINEHKGNTLPEFSLNTKDYREVLFSDKKTLTSFFIVEDNRDYIDGQHFNTNCSIIFQGNLKKIFPSITHRADEELNKDCFNALKKSFNGLQITNMITGINNVYSDFSFDENTRERLNIVDLSQNHVLKLNFTLKYKYCNE